MEEDHSYGGALYEGDDGAGHDDGDGGWDYAAAGGEEGHNMHMMEEGREGYGDHAAEYGHADEPGHEHMEGHDGGEEMYYGGVCNSFIVQPDVRDTHVRCDLFFASQHHLSRPGDARDGCREPGGDVSSDKPCQSIHTLPRSPRRSLSLAFARVGASPSAPHSLPCGVAHPARLLSRASNPVILIKLLMPRITNPLPPARAHTHTHIYIYMYIYIYIYTHTHTHTQHTATIIDEQKGSRCKRIIWKAARMRDSSPRWGRRHKKIWQRARTWA